jgi:hypothetical protein
MRHLSVAVQPFRVRRGRGTLASCECSRAQRPETAEMRDYIFRYRCGPRSPRRPAQLGTQPAASHRLQQEALAAGSLPPNAELLERWAALRQGAPRVAKPLAG